MANFTKGPWEIASYRNYFGFSVWSPNGPCIAERWWQHERTPEQNEEMQANALYHGAWSMDESEAWANSLIVHITSRQIGTKAAIAKAEGK